MPYEFFEIFVSNYLEFPIERWRWKNFTPLEIASKGDQSLLINTTAMDMLQALRDRMGVPLIINSGYRDPEHNKAIGGKPNSYHLKGKAFDISFKGLDKDLLYKNAKLVGFTGFGHYPDFLHVDCGKKREWYSNLLEAL